MVYDHHHGRTFSLELCVSVVGLEGGDVVRPQRGEGLVRTVRLLQGHRHTQTSNRRVRKKVGEGHVQSGAEETGNQHGVCLDCPWRCFNVDVWDAVVENVRGLMEGAR